MGGATRCNQRRIRAYFLVKRTIAKRFTLALPWFSYGQNAPTKPIRTKLAIDPIRLPDRSFWSRIFPCWKELKQPAKTNWQCCTKEKARRRIIFGGPRKLGWLPSLHQARDINAQFATHGLFNRLESQCMIFMACHSRNGQGAHHARALNAQGEATACWRIILIRHASPFEGMEPLFTPTLPKI